MRTVFGKLKKKKSAQAAKANTAHQDWTMRSFKFLEAHLIIRTDTRQLGKVPQVMEEEEEEEADDDYASSVRSSSQPLSSAEASSSQAGTSHVKDSRNSRPKAPSTTAKRVDEAILQIADQMS